MLNAFINRTTQIVSGKITIRSLFIFSFRFSALFSSFPDYITFRTQRRFAWRDPFYLTRLRQSDTRDRRFSNGTQSKYENWKNTELETRKFSSTHVKCEKYHYLFSQLVDTICGRVHACPLWLWARSKRIRNCTISSVNLQSSYT